MVNPQVLFHRAGLIAWRGDEPAAGVPIDSASNDALKSLHCPRGVGSTGTANQGCEAVLTLSGGSLDGRLVVLGHAVPLVWLALRPRVWQTPISTSAEPWGGGVPAMPRALKR